MSDQSERVKAVFLEAIEKHAPEQWPAFLEQACAGDAALRAGVEQLLRARSELGSFHEPPRPAPLATVDDPVSERPGTVIGPYKLIQEVGAGGMGTVWMAQQKEPVKRLVALKVIKPGMDSRQVIARFEAERQALALMDHPNIARVFDAGTTSAGRPYFVMELVKGVPLTKYCDERRLTPKERLELFIPVCQAIQHAHQKGIIHRDIKPSNVLVAVYDGKPVPKVIDFGVAKATGQQLTEHTLVTSFGAVVGTLEYMSPEQAELNQLDIDTRSDIYSLGVLLYELLTGSTPLGKKRLKEAAMLEVLRLIREEESPKPSTRLSTTEGLPSIAANRGLEPKKLSGLVRGELDWIVMKALEKDRNRRYETANGFALDVQRYLADETVQACPPSAGYRLRKFARKYRKLLRIAGVFVLFLALAAAVSTWQAVRATLAERQALVERDRAAASFRMARDAVDQLLTQVSQSPKLKTHAMEKFRKELLQNAKGFYERFIREQFDAPGVRYDLGLAHRRLAEIHRELGDYAAAEESATKAVALLRDLAHAQPDVAEYRRDLAASYATLGLVYWDTARWDEAEAAYQQALDIQENQAGAYPEAAEYRYALAKTYSASGLTHYRAERPERAAKRYQQAVDILSKLILNYPLVAEYQSLMAATQMNRGQLYLTQGRYDEAETALKDAGRIYGRFVSGPDVLPEYQQSQARSYAILGHVYRDRVESEKAEAIQQQALQILEKLAQEHPDVQEYAYDVGRCYYELAETADRGGRPDAALVRYDKAIDIMEGAVGKGYLAARPQLVGARINRAGALAGRGDHARATDEAEAVARQGNLHSVNLYDLACVFSRSSAAADHDTKLSPADRTRLKARYADRAMDFLRQAVAQGWNNPRVMEKDPDIHPLRARPDFRKMFPDLEGKTKE